LFVRPGWVSTSADLDVLPEIDLAHRHEVDVQVLHHRAVLGATDDAAEPDHRIALGELPHDVLEGRRARERIRVGIVVREDDERRRSLDRVEERDQRSLGLAHGE
jgi:hypothetical protein